MKRHIALAVAFAMGRPQLPQTRADIVPTPDDWPFCTTGKRKAQWKQEQGPQRRGKGGRR